MFTEILAKIPANRAAKKMVINMAEAVCRNGTPRLSLKLTLSQNIKLYFLIFFIVKLILAP